MRAGRPAGSGLISRREQEIGKHIESQTDGTNGVTDRMAAAGGGNLEEGHGTKQCSVPA